MCTSENIRHKAIVHPKMKLTHHLMALIWFQTSMTKKKFQLNIDAFFFFKTIKADSDQWLLRSKNHYQIIIKNSLNSLK